MVDTIDEFMDRRRHRRVAAQNTARINFDGFWHSCPVSDLSGGGGSFRSWLQPPVGSNVLVQMRGLGVIRARVARRWEQGFAVEFDAEDYDSDALVDNLTLSANPGLLGLSGGDAPAKQSGEAQQAAAKATNAEVPQAPASADDDPSDTEATPASAADETDGGRRRHPLRSVRKALG